MREEILIAIVMFAVTIAGSVWKRNDRKWSVLFLLLASVAGSLVAGMGVRFREIVEGPFGFLDVSLSVVCASIFVWLCYVGGTFNAMFSGISKIRNSLLKAAATLLFIALPAALTGFAMASVLTTGKIVADNLKKGSVEGRKITIAIAGGAFIGMIMPPNCIPAMIAANGSGSVLPTPYVGFFLPLLLTAIPSFIVFALINKKTLSATAEEEQNVQKQGASMAVLALVCALMIVEGVLSSFIYIGGNTLIFALASIVVIIINKGFGGLKKCLDTVTDGLENAVWPVAFMFALGSFIEISSMTGIRGIYSLWILPYQVPSVMLVLMAASIVIGFFLGSPIPAFLITYAVFPIGWLANTVVVTGCAMALACVGVLNCRGGLLDSTSEALGTQAKYKDTIKGLLPIIAITLAIGVIWVLCGDNLSALIL